MSEHAGIGRHWSAVISTESEQTLRLEEGRTLGYAEWGDASGFPLFHFHGSSSSRLERPLQQEVLEGVRLVTIDRPGHGLSDFQPERTLLDWPDDVEALANHLRIEQFAVSGWSAGGAYALACAHRIPERLTRVGLISSFAPSDRPGATAGMDRFNKIALAMARRMPWAVTRWLTHMMGRAFAKDPEGTAQRRFSSLPAPDRDALNDRRARLLTQPWGFRLHDIAIPVALWHGDADSNSPVAAATYLSRTIPSASLTVYPEEGHFFILKRWGEIIHQLTALT